MKVAQGATARISQSTPSLPWRRDDASPCRSRAFFNCCATLKADSVNTPRKRCKTWSKRPKLPCKHRSAHKYAHQRF
eukprot:5348752-Pleurochrysis_carterae.AAC.7